MLTILFIILMIAVFGKLGFTALKAAWNITAVILLLVVLPIALIVFVIVGLIKLAIPILAVVGLVSLLKSRK